jgi:hypothetical protein
MSQENTKALAAQAIETVSCSVPGCRQAGELLPGFDYLNKRREPGDFIKPGELANYALCRKHARNVGNAARHKGVIHERITKRELEEEKKAKKRRARQEAEKAAAEARRKAIEQQKLADEAAAEFRAQLEARQAQAKAEKAYETYMAKLRPNTMTDFKGNNLPKKVGCVFGECTCQGEFVPGLNILKDSLGREVEENDLSAFALCLEHMKLVGKESGLKLHKLEAAAHLIRTYGPARKAAREENKAEQNKAAVDYLSRLGLAIDKSEASKPEAKSNVVELNTGAIKCIGRGCGNVIPAEKHTNVCDACRHVVTV